MGILDMQVLALAIRYAVDVLDCWYSFRVTAEGDEAVTFAFLGVGVADDFRVCDRAIESEEAVKIELIGIRWQVAYVESCRCFSLGLPCHPACSSQCSCARI